MNEPNSAIKSFITDELLMDPDRDLGDEEDLLLSGLVDSLGVMRLVYFLEELGGEKIPFTDITIENFNNISAISNYLSSR